MIELSAAEARRVALNAQGFGGPRKGADVRAMRRVVSQLLCIQIDAVNVLVRSHYIPLFSRLGPYSLKQFDNLVYEKRAMFEYSGHALSLIATELHPLLRWRMDEATQNKHWKQNEINLERSRPGYIATVEAEVAERGPLAYTDLRDSGKREKVPTKYAESSMLWWRWSDGKLVMGNLAAAGRLTVSRRRSFEPLYDLTERVIPAKILAAPTPSATDAQRELARLAVGALGVATVKDVADYFRLPVAPTRARLRELVETGDVAAARVEGWKDGAFAAPKASSKRVQAASVLSPFDSLIWERKRTERIFDFKHVFELYVPPPKRVYGYYVLPLLLDESIVARVDLKAERAASTLAVKAAFSEPGESPKKRIVSELASEVRRVANWLELESVSVDDRGDLGPALRRALR